MKRILFPFVVTMLLLVGNCTKKDPETIASDWYVRTKHEIMKYADLHSDSSVMTIRDDGFATTDAYVNGRIFIRTTRDGMHTRARSYFSGDFELRQELCDNGELSFEGVVYNSTFYGWSTWRRCNGQLEERGIRFNNVRVGVWRKYDEDGNLVEQTDYQRQEKLDSLPVI